uniref:Meis_PKNOX_N domain-containing protein n=1 Tax=Angiostrongylus cantonensis TaxID=6313 RepID=A0A0K0D732_ANGCA
MLDINSTSLQRFKNSLLKNIRKKTIFQLFRKLDSKGVSTRTNNEKLDKFMKDAIIVLRTHLSELQKVASLTEDFHTKYLSERSTLLNLAEIAELTFGIYNRVGFRCDYSVF